MKGRGLGLAVTFVLGLSLAACSGSNGGEGSPQCDLDCLVPPAAVCDGNSAVTYAAPGVCEADGTCTFTPSSADCGEGTCVDGACQAAVGPCEGVTCDAPPTASCDGTVVVSYEPVGQCDEGTCNYGEIRTDCADDGEICEAGACVANGDPCEGVVCDPILECEGNAAVEEQGTCIDGTCSYAQVSRRDCTVDGGTCEDGICQFTDPCEGVTCDAPPATACDGATVVQYSPTGTCVDGDCSYTESRQNCSDLGLICSEGACIERPVCFGVVCDEGPESTCLGEVAYTYGEGTCQLVTNGEGVETEQCVYEETVANCSTTDQVCDAGVCVDPDPCLGVDCTVADAPFCEGEVAVSFTAPGACVDGLCAFDENREDCAAAGGFCEGGECTIEDPCDGVVCNSPPAADCAENVARTYNLPGTCVAGSCEYEIDTEDCSPDGNTCIDGACVFVDVCDGVTCDPPAPACIAGVLAVVVDAPGTCVNEEASPVCEYADVQTITNCSDTGEVCLAGACVGEGALLTAGAVVLTEVYLAADAQWVEIHNPAATPVDVSDLELRNIGGASFALPPDTVIPAGGYLVVASDDGTAATVGADVAWGGLASFSFAPGVGDSVTLFGAEEVASVAIDASWVIAGRSLGVDPALLPTGSSSRGDWCAAIDAITIGLSGSPGRANPACAARFVGDEFVINEIYGAGLTLPSTSTEEWLEIVNVSGAPVNLAGVDLATDSGLYRFGSVVVEADAYFVIGNGTAVAARNVDHVWGGLQLNGTAGSVALVLPYYDEVGGVVTAIEFDYVEYDGSWPAATGASLSRASLTGSSTDAAAWCASTTSYASPVEAYGTPGGANDCD